MAAKSSRGLNATAISAEFLAEEKGTGVPTNNHVDLVAWVTRATKQV